MWYLNCGKGVSRATTTTTSMWRSKAQPTTVWRCSGPCASLVCADRSGMLKPSTRGLQCSQVLCPTRWKLCSHLPWWKHFSCLEDRKPGRIAALEYWVRTEANRIKTCLWFVTGLRRRNTLATTSRTDSMCVFTQLWPPLRLEPNCDLSWKNLQAATASLWKLLDFL